MALLGFVGYLMNFVEFLPFMTYDGESVWKTIKLYRVRGYGEVATNLKYGYCGYGIFMLIFSLMNLFVYLDAGNPKIYLCFDQMSFISRIPC